MIRRCVWSKAVRRARAAYTELHWRIRGLGGVWITQPLVIDSSFLFIQNDCLPLPEYSAECVKRETWLLSCRHSLPGENYRLFKKNLLVHTRGKLPKICCVSSAFTSYTLFSLDSTREDDISSFLYFKDIMNNDF